ncbi:hypothetical protein [Hyphomonas sp.]|jgi:hypothetical protein|uniref:hypothetical protein n=1 Tax=Hyphomonas sp. TaxID=87 RepID=UPI003001953C|tara:strand:+ start:770 stop:976 length:207 start_codon:yes stop_codon:yes gene_type:complete
MKKMMLATAFLSLGTFAACDATDEPDEVDITVEEPDTLSDELEEAGDDAEAAVNDAGEAMTEPTDTPQ